MTETVDLEELKDRLDGDKELFLEISEVFFADYVGQADALSAAISSGSAITVRERAHTIKGALANLSVKKAMEIAFKLESAGKDGQLGDAQSLLTQLNEEIKNFQVFVEKVKKGEIWNS